MSKDPDSHIECSINELTNELIIEEREDEFYTEISSVKTGYIFKDTLILPRESIRSIEIQNKSIKNGDEEGFQFIRITYNNYLVKEINIRFFPNMKIQEWKDKVVNPIEVFLKIKR